MVGGQMLDLAAEGRFADGKPQALDETAVKTLQAMKTGALLRFACVAGSILGKANAAERQALDRYGAIIGQAFQIADDLLDVEGDSATLGKATRQGCRGRQGDAGCDPRDGPCEGTVGGPGRGGGGGARALRRGGRRPQGGRALRGRSKRLIAPWEGGRPRPPFGQSDTPRFAAREMAGEDACPPRLSTVAGRRFYSAAVRVAWPKRRSI